MTTTRLREWRGVKPVATPSGTTITTRLRTTPADDAVLDAVAGHLGRLRRADLAAVSFPEPPTPGLDTAGQRHAGREALNARKRILTAQSSSRWAHSVISANDAQRRSARDALARHISDLRAATEAIKQRLAQPTADVLSQEERAARKKARLPKGYASQAERYQKQRRLQSLRAEESRAVAEYDDGRVRVTEGGKRLARARHNLKTARPTAAQWRERWQAARWRIEAIGCKAEPFSNLTITITPGGAVSIRLPRPLEHLANAPHGRYALSGTARFAYRADEWLARITGGKPVSYTFTRKPGRAGVYLTAAWAHQPETLGTRAHSGGPVIGVDLNDGHLAVRRLDPCGNPLGRPERIEFQLIGTTARRDAQVRHAITRLIRYTKRHRITAIAVEDLNFADARATGRETMGRGRRGKRFRRTVAGIPTSVFRSRFTGQSHKHGIALWAVNPAYTSVWGDQHWRNPYENVTRHEAGSHRDRAPRPGPQGPATGRCDTRATRGSRRESYQPGRAE